MLKEEATAQSRVHWHVEDLGIRHAYIIRGTPQENGKVERSQRSDGQECYQLLSYKDDVDLKAKLDECECVYNFHRPRGAHAGKTPYKALREGYNQQTGRLTSNSTLQYFPIGYSIHECVNFAMLFKLFFQ